MLKEDGAKILFILIKHIAHAKPGNPETYINYKAVHDILKLPLHGRTYGDSLKKQGLENLADWTVENNLPGITGLVIDSTTFRPGQGYYRIFNKDEDDFSWWEEQIRLSKEFDWLLHLPIEYIPEDMTGIPEAIDLSLPQRENISIQRIIRDTPLSRKVKMIHNYECQICGHTIVLQNGQRYAEAHHLRPLGKPHNGPDVSENIICVCPNHHAEFDYGIVRIVSEELRQRPNHIISKEYIGYNNRVIFQEFEYFKGKH